MSCNTYKNSWMSSENWDIRKREEEVIFLIKCLIFQVYFLLPKLCFTSSYEPKMTSHWVTSHFSCIASSAAFVPTSSAFLPVLPPVPLAQTHSSGRVERQSACPYPLPLFVLGHLCAGLGYTHSLALWWSGCWVAPNTSYPTHRGQVKTLVLNCIK